MKKHKKHSQTKYICIKKAIHTDEYLRKFILDNSFMRNKIGNDFREEAEKYKGSDNMYWNFDPWEFKAQYYNNIEEPENRYSYYTVGLSEQVADDFRTALKTIRTVNENILKHISQNGIYNNSSKLWGFHYKSFDFNKYSFRVKLKPGYTNGHFYSGLSILDKNTIKFKVRGNYAGHPEERICIKLKENLFDEIIPNDDGNHHIIMHYNSRCCRNECNFDVKDIKDISFAYECGKYYILLFINAAYNINKKSLKYSKDRVCGIDTGIRHPVTLHDGNNTMYLSMDDKTTRKIHYLERRIRRLQHYKDIKWKYNYDHGLSTHSNNIIKLCKKIRRLYRKITNIKNFWIQNRCKEIATTYSKICVDRFIQPNHNDEESKKIPKSVMKKINYANRFHKMFYFNEFLKHDCIKYGCEYIESPEDTTRTCSICGYVNEHLPLNKTHLICAKCNNVIERDMNAARNCYDYLVDNT